MKEPLKAQSNDIKNVAAEKAAIRIDIAKTAATFSVNGKDLIVKDGNGKVVDVIKDFMTMIKEGKMPILILGLKEVSASDILAKLNGGEAIYIAPLLDPAFDVEERNSSFEHFNEVLTLSQMLESSPWNNMGWNIADLEYRLQSLRALIGENNRINPADGRGMRDRPNGPDQNRDASDNGPRVPRDPVPDPLPRPDPRPHPSDPNPNPNPNPDPNPDPAPDPDPDPAPDPDPDPSPGFLFDNGPNIVDLNAVRAGDYTEGSQYDTGGGEDVITGFDTLQAAIDAGFDLTHVLNLGSGNDIFIGGAVGMIINGGGGDDILTGGEGNDTLTGSTGDDTIDGGAGNDIISGGGGNDVLSGGEGTDSITGGVDNDRFVYSVDAVWAAGSTMNYPGDSLAITIEGKNRNFDTYDGSDGIDTLEGTNGADVLSYSNGNIRNIEIFDMGNGDDVVLLANGNISSITVYGGAGDDIIATGDGNDTIDGGDGDDYLYGAAGHNTILGGNGSDFIYYSSSSSTTITQAMTFGSTGVTQNVVLNFSTSLYDGGNEVDNLQGTAGDDYISYNVIGFAARILNFEVIDGGEGNDYVDMSAYSQGITLYGGGGHDTVIGSSADDALVGDGGNDHLMGGEGNDYIDGSDGNDLIEGGAGNDLLAGGSGQDTFVYSVDDVFDSGFIVTYNVRVPFVDIGGMNYNSDYYHGEDGIDTILGTSGNDFLEFAIDLANNYTYGNIRSVEIFRMGDGNDVLLLGSSSYTTEGEDENGNPTTVEITLGFDIEYDVEVYGDNGNDVLMTGSGDDYLDGGSGNDILYGGAGTNILNGGSGSDTLHFNYDNIADTIVKNVTFGATGVTQNITYTVSYSIYDGGLGTDSLSTSGSGLENIYISYTMVGFSEIFINNIEVIYGGNGNDYIDMGLGAYSNNLQIYSGEGNDTVIGTARNDDVVAQGGHDTIYTGGGQDTIFADDGDDFIDAGAGDDFIFGGAGDDIIRGGAGSDLLAGGGDRSDPNGFWNIAGSGNDQFLYTGADLDNTAAVDRITDFRGGNVAGSDQIVLQDILIGYQDGVSDLSLFARFVSNAGIVSFQVDLDGAAAGHDWQTVAIIQGSDPGSANINDNVRLSLGAS
ncbi:MAG: calcium-binding protein [Dongiaceae bacterium]